MIRDERRHSYDAAWCPDCGSFREASATSDPEPWLAPGNAPPPPAAPKPQESPGKTAMF